MTQELVVWVLLSAMVGAIWILTCLMLTKDHTVIAQPDEEAGENTDEKSLAATSSQKSAHRRVAA
jgi:hypothetical protein